MIELLTKIGIPEQYAGDIWALVIFFVCSVILILVVKKRNLGAILISVYVAYAILTKAFFEFLEDQNVMLAVFLILLLVLFQIFKRFIRMGIGGSKMALWTKVVVISLSIIGLLISVAMRWFPPSIIEKFFSPSFVEIFLSKEAQLVWMIAPLVLIFLLVQKKH